MNNHEIAIFGGSFDPPTMMHQQIMRALLARKEFDEVWVMPSGERTDKPHATRVAQRLAMLATMKAELFDGDNRLRISDFEATLPQPSETSYTAAALRAAYPGNEFWFVFGADSIASMHTWRGGDELLASLPMIAVPREGYTIPPEATHVRELSDISGASQPVSSTEVRRRVARGESLEGMASRGVAAFIQQHRMYRVA